ncbi:1590_t:CDS:2, partial [Gigaspora margarita]
MVDQRKIVTQDLINVAIEHYELESDRAKAIGESLSEMLIPIIVQQYKGRRACDGLGFEPYGREYEICVEMYRKDILTPLMVLVSKASGVIDNIIKGIPTESDPIVDARGTIWKSAENIICIIWALSEASQEVLRGINNTNITPFLMSCLIQTCTVPTNTVVSADGDDDGWQDEPQEDDDMMSTNVKEDNIMEDIIIMGVNQPDEQSKIHPILNTFATIILPKLLIMMNLFLFKAAIRKMDLRDLRLRADKAYENLVAFINYKRDERNN